jgi:hypothetical protein
MASGAGRSSGIRRPSLIFRRGIGLATLAASVLLFATPGSASDSPGTVYLDRGHRNDVVVSIDLYRLSPALQGADTIAIDLRDLTLTVADAERPNERRPLAATWIRRPTTRSTPPSIAYAAALVLPMDHPGVRLVQVHVPSQLSVLRGGVALGTIAMPSPDRPTWTTVRYAVPDRADDADARRALVGKTMWRRGLGRLRCDAPGPIYADLVPETIVDVERVPAATTTYLGDLNSDMTMHDDNNPGNFGPPNTLFFGLDPWRVTMHSAGGTSSAVYGSTTELREAFSPTPPPRRLALEALCLRERMTFDDVAWTLGPPNVPPDAFHVLATTTWATLARKTTIEWATPTTHVTVGFASGRVVSIATDDGP